MKKLIAINLFLVINLYAQISPGELSIHHAQFEGLNNCTKCHTIGQGLENKKCLACHAEIRSRIEKNIGYHSSIEVKGKDCWACHSEHNGRNFKIINFNHKEFDHRKTGYELTGKHKTIDCSECHNQKFIKEPNLKKEKTYLGLNKNCNSCHEDVHQQTAGNNCENCHNTTSFTSDIKFDHSKTSFPLLGSHKNVNCIDCHKRTEINQSTIIKFISKSKILCTDCHIDIHQNKFGSNCLNCHNYNSFKNAVRQVFDHTKTNFPLLGEHRFLECKDCHKGKLTEPIKHNKCIDCHKDYHKGQFVINNTIRDCKECHTEEGFTPSTYTIESHQKTKFVLTGSHLAVDCRACHYKNNEWSFRFNSMKCVECHQNVHNQEISLKFIGEDKCENCHNTVNWSKVKFDHSQTNFVLAGKHISITCRSCHIKEIQGKKVHLFKSLKSGCLDCHLDNHYKQYSSEECLSCHTFDDWKPTKFNHNNSQFKLSGAHEKVECYKCHPRMNMDDGGTFVLFKTRRVKCSDCHSS